MSSCFSFVICSRILSRHVPPCSKSVYTCPPSLVKATPPTYLNAVLPAVLHRPPSRSEPPCHTIFNFECGVARFVPLRRRAKSSARPTRTWRVCKRASRSGPTSSSRSRATIAAAAAARARPIGS
eukprot:933684-Pleurochrysis_carterae.AAC.1